MVSIQGWTLGTDEPKSRCRFTSTFLGWGSLLLLSVSERVSVPKLLSSPGGERNMMQSDMQQNPSVSHAAGSGAQRARPSAHHPFSELLPPCLGQACRVWSQLMETGTLVTTSQTIQPVMTGECRHDCSLIVMVPTLRLLTTSSMVHRHFRQKESFSSRQPRKTVKVFFFPQFNY